MMKLYIHRATCSLSPHIVARELDLDVRIVEVERGMQRTRDGEDFLGINPNGYVPVLVLDDGETLMEGPAIVQHLANMRPGGGLAPGDARERRRIQEIDLARWPRLEAFMRQVGARPAVREALEAEGLAHRADGIFFAPRDAA